MALILIGGMTMSQNVLSSADTTSIGIQQLTTRDEAILKTGITPLEADLQSSTTLDISIRNSGQNKLASFNLWDGIIQYTNGSQLYATWMPYISGTPGNNQWTVTGIYLSAPDPTPEAYESGILNPGEEMIIRIKISPSVSRYTNNQAVISTPNGVSALIPFARN